MKISFEEATKNSNVLRTLEGQVSNVFSEKFLTKFYEYCFEFSYQECRNYLDLPIPKENNRLEHDVYFSRVCRFRRELFLRDLILELQLVTFRKKCEKLRIDVSSKKAESIEVSKQDLIEEARKYEERFVFPSESEIKRRLEVTYEKR